MFFANILSPAVTSLATQSSIATLPTNLESADKIGVPKDISGIVLPIGATMHMDGSVLAAILKISFLFGIFGMEFAGWQTYLISIVIAILSGVVLSGVGCILRGRIRDASGVNIREITEHCEIVSLNGTVSRERCHIHIALSKEDLSTIGGHLCPGCIVNTTCEFVLGELPGIVYGVEEDPETGYDELIFRNE